MNALTLIALAVYIASCTDGDTALLLPRSFNARHAFRRLQVSPFDHLQTAFVLLVLDVR